MIVTILILVATTVFAPFTLAAAPAIKEFHEPVNDTTLYFSVHTVDPAAPYILFLHGGPGQTSAHLRAQYEVHQWNLNAIFLDQRSCGKSARNVPKKSFLFDNLIRDIDGVLDKLGLKKVLVLGHSWGGTYALKYALQRPDRVMAVMAVDFVVSWREALNNYYQVTASMARQNVNILKKIAADKKLSSAEWRSIQRLCGFMAGYYLEEKETKEPGTLFKKCFDQPRAISKKAASLLKQELAEDSTVLAKHKQAGELWEGWDARGISDKYGLYAFWPGHNRALYQKARQLIKQWYQPKELEHSKAIQEGLHLNKGWSDYHARGEVEQVKTPFYYLFGQHDVLFKSEALAKFVSRRFGKNHVVRFDRSGHNPMGDEPQRFKQIVERIYRGH